MLQDHDSQRQLPAGVFSVEYLFGSGGDDVLAGLSKTGEIQTFGAHRAVGGNAAARNVFFLINGRVVWEPAVGCSTVIAVCPLCSPVVFGFAEILGGTAFKAKITTLTESRFLAVSGDELTLILQNRADVCFTACKALGRLYSQTIDLLHDI